MSSYAFSPQFYQHWTQAPESIRAAIVQELTDITTLLQTETSFESFTFSIDDLDAHLNNLSEAHEKQAAAKQSADEQAQQAKDKQKLDEQLKLAQVAKKQAKEAQDKQQQREEQQAKDKQQAKDNQEAINKANAGKANTTADINDETSDKKASSNKTAHISINDNQDRADDKHIAKGDASASTAIKESMAADLNLDSDLKHAKLAASTREDLITALEIKIDDYLAEQMLKISEDLKSWLRTELNRQSPEQEQIVAGKDVKSTNK